MVLEGFRCTATPALRMRLARASVECPEYGKVMCPLNLDSGLSWGVLRAALGLMTLAHADLVYPDTVSTLLMWSISWILAASVEQCPDHSQLVL